MVIPIIRPNKGVLSLGLQLDTSVTLHCFFFLLGVLAWSVAAGDVITQQFAERSGTNHDSSYGSGWTIVIGPVLRSWYLTLERIVPGAVKTAGFKKMLLDQSLFAPLMICFYFIVSETPAGKRLHEINEMLQECYVQTLMITNYKILLLAQTLNFTFVPIQHRADFVQIVAIFWNSYLSWMAN